jgi:acyl carrier protein
MTMDIQSLVITKLVDHLPEPCCRSRVDPAASLLDLRFDSLTVLEVVYELEEQLDITVELSELHQLLTVSDLVAAIDKTAKRVV